MTNRFQDIQSNQQGRSDLTSLHASVRLNRNNLRGNQENEAVENNHYKIKNKMLYYLGKTYIPRNSVEDVMKIAHVCPAAGRFSVFKMMARLECFIDETRLNM